MLYFYFRCVRLSAAWNSQRDLEQAAEPFPVEISEELPLMENAVDGTHLRPQCTNSNPSSVGGEEENVSEKGQHRSSLVPKLSSGLLQDDRCLAKQHPSTVEGK